eukprot:CAMPEP_0206200774 /NCGR_PEP_ID=MMETSP0166-20121206/11094_1 /ASSEMBLY_ACC=CAM_ASM_000260 /TAXON_ID=95228 /ORGANISM="Vannella robusta, Strain DIVA3 518/3/11/1/6" /LENGTH=40 /DNA_ID= /DNA_START= /DNA_END= /DNA_ORIENTATION=
MIPITVPSDKRDHKKIPKIPKILATVFLDGIKHPEHIHKI